jgi:peptidylprolyl isomerase
MPRRSFQYRVSCRALAAALFMGLAAACLDTGEPTANMPSNPATETYAASLGVNISQMTKKSDALYVQDLVVGTGAEATNGKTLGMTYTGWLVNGTQFDSNVGKTTFSFVLGNQDVIAGWDLGIVGMRIGGKRRLVIGSDLAYGPGGRGSIGPNSTLVFDVVLVSVR